MYAELGSGFGAVGLAGPDGVERVGVGAGVVGVAGRRSRSRRRRSIEEAQRTRLVAPVPRGLHLVELGGDPQPLRHGSALRDEGRGGLVAGVDVLLGSDLPSCLRVGRRGADLRAGRDLVDEPQPEAVVLLVELEAAHHLGRLLGGADPEHRVARRGLLDLLGQLTPGMRDRRVLVVDHGRLRIRRHRRGRGRYCGGCRGRRRRRIRRRDARRGPVSRIVRFVRGSQGRLREQSAEEDQCCCPPCCCGHGGLPLGVCDCCDCRYA